MESHAEFLRRVTLDESLSEAIKRDYKAADLSPADRAMLDYAAKLTLHPAQVQREDVESLRKHGFEDVAILQINLIASWFNFINRVADGLGVGRE
ncbi:MAG: peroxidase [Chloroflexi bacterium]|nr:peroxidase [Chloroflexota bacterium]